MADEPAPAVEDDGAAPGASAAPGAGEPEGAAASEPAGAQPQRPPRPPEPPVPAKRAAPASAEPATEVMPAASAISIAGHPRATRMVRRAREMAGLAGFVIGGWMSLHTHSFPEAALRAVVAGLVCQVIVWAAAVLLSRYLIVAELRAREHALVQAVRGGRNGEPAREAHR